MQTIGGKTIFGNRIDLEAEWKARQGEMNYAKGGGVDSSTITDLADFDTETTLVFDGDADFADYPEITDLGNLQKITGDAYFDESEVENLGHLQIIGNVAIFKKSKVKDLGNLQRIGSRSYFGKRIDLQKQWEKRASEDELEEIVLEDEYAEGGGVGEDNSIKTIIVLEKNNQINSDIKNFKVEYEIGVFPSGIKKDTNNLIITRYSDEFGGSQKSVVKTLSKSEAKRIFNEITYYKNYG